MKLETSCGAVVFTRVDGEIRYVVICSTEGIHGFPKGHVEGNETERETALREIREEVGLRPQILEDWRVTDEYPLPKKPGVMKRVVYFLAEYAGQEITIQETELTGAELMPFEAALEALEFESAKRVLREAHAFLNG